MKIKTYYINLNKDKKRNEEIINELNKTNLKYLNLTNCSGFAGISYFEQKKGP